MGWGQNGDGCPRFIGPESFSFQVAYLSCFFPWHPISSKLSPEYFEPVSGVGGSWAKKKHSVTFAPPQLAAGKDAVRGGPGESEGRLCLPAGPGGVKPRGRHPSVEVPVFSFLVCEVGLQHGLRSPAGCCEDERR